MNLSMTGQWAQIGQARLARCFDENRLSFCDVGAARCLAAPCRGLLPAKPVTAVALDLAIGPLPP